MSLLTVNLDKQYIVKNLGAEGMDAWLLSEGVDVSDIPEVTDATTWIGLDTPAWCWFNNTTDMAFQKKYGKLYNGYAKVLINTRLSSAGSLWRVPAFADWENTRNWAIANGFNWDSTTEENKIGKALASNGGEWDSSGTEGYVGNNQISNNRSEFTGLPGGSRYRVNGDFLFLGTRGIFWGSEAGKTISLTNVREDLFLREGAWLNNDGLSIRLTRNLYTLTFNPNGGSSVSALQIGDMDTATAPTAPSRAGYNFNGWYSDAELTTDWDFATNTVTEDVTLYAGWVERRKSAGSRIGAGIGIGIGI